MSRQDHFAAIIIQQEMSSHEWRFGCIEGRGDFLFELSLPLPGRSSFPDNQWDLIFGGLVEDGSGFPIHSEENIQEGMTTLQIIQRIPPHGYRGVSADFGCHGEMIAMILIHQPMHPLDRAEFAENIRSLHLNW